MVDITAGTVLSTQQLGTFSLAADERGVLRDDVLATAPSPELGS